MYLVIKKRGDKMTISVHRKRLFFYEKDNRENIDNQISNTALMMKKRGLSCLPDKMLKKDEDLSDG